MSMTYSDILILLKAGYTKDDIDNMQAPTESQALLLSPETPASSAVAAASVPSESLPQESVPAPAVGDPEPDPQPAANPVGDQIAQLQQMISSLITQVQNGNRNNAEMGARIIDPHASAIDTLRSISSIPTTKEE